MRIRLKHRCLAERLARSRLSQNAWAHRLGLSPGHLSRLVNGRRPYPGPATRRKLMKGLGVAFEALFEIETAGSSKPRKKGGGLRVNGRRRMPSASERASQEAMGMGRISQDVRDGWRALRRSPGYALLSVFTLALAIGVNTAIFSMVSVILFTEMPIQDGDRLGFLFAANPQRGIEQADLTPREYLEYREGVGAFEQLAAITEIDRFVLSSSGEPEPVNGFRASWNLFQVWGTGPVLGRGFLPEEDRPGADLVTIVSFSTWRDRFGSDEAILGTTIQLDGRPATIIGVMDPAMEVGDISRGQFWIPLRLNPSQLTEERQLVATGKLRPGASLEQARQEMEAVHDGLRQRFQQDYAGWQPSLLDYDSFIVGEGFWGVLVMLAVTVACVLLTACSNVATLTLARASVRRRELALRAALGAGRVQILRQLLTESILIALAAGAAGLVLTRLCLEWMVWMVSEQSGMGVFVRMLSIDGHALLFTLSVSLAAPLLFGLLPALGATRLNLGGALQSSGQRLTGERSGLGGRRFLVALQVSLALALMTVSGLLLRSIAESRLLERGFESKGLLTLRLELPEGKYPDEQRIRNFFDETLTRIRQLPEIESAAWVSRRLYAEGTAQAALRVEGLQTEAEDSPWAGLVVASPGYLEVQGVSLLLGRGLLESDADGAPPVALVSQELARRHWPDGSPLGRRIQVGGNESGNAWLTVVGVVGDVRLNKQANPLVYVSFAQNTRRSMALLTRPRGSNAQAVAAIRQAVLTVDPDQPLQDVRSMEQIYADAVAPSNMLISLFTAFAAFALAMSSAGIYGVTAYSVARRSREFGIRMALGALRKNVLSLVFRQAFRLVGIGIVLGALGGWALVQVLASALVGLSEIGPSTLLWPALTLAAVAFLACYLPARRATRIDPVIALRME